MTAARDAWPGRFADVRVGQLVFVDELGANTSMQRTHGRAAAGERVVSAVPAGHYKSVSTIAAMGVGGIVGSATFVGATDAAVSLAFVRERLVPGLRPGQVVVFDNLSAHGSPRVDALVEAAGCRVVRLPPYSPDLNPIEMAFSKVKTSLRKLARRTVTTLIRGIVEALKTIRGSDALGYLGKCGYATQ